MWVARTVSQSEVVVGRADQVDRLVTDINARRCSVAVNLAVIPRRTWMEALREPGDVLKWRDLRVSWEA